jgi:hypothetical protein
MERASGDMEVRKEEESTERGLTDRNTARSLKAAQEG